VPYDTGPRELFLKVFKEMEKSFALVSRSIVLRHRSLLGHASDPADANGIVIRTLNMSPRSFN
jgi:hypothetical protein